MSPVVADFMGHLVTGLWGAKKLANVHTLLCIIAQRQCVFINPFANSLKLMRLLVFIGYHDSSPVLRQNVFFCVRFYHTKYNLTAIMSKQPYQPLFFLQFKP